MGPGWLSRSVKGLHRTLVLVVLALTAGCVGLFGPTSTPTPVTPMPVDVQPAPGVPASDGAGTSPVRVDSDRLLAANERVRSNGSYTLERTVTVDGPNGSLRLRHVQRVGANGTVIERVRANGSGQLSPVFINGTLWANGSTRWTRFRLRHGKTVTNRMVSLESSPFVTGRPLPERLVPGTEFAVEERRDGVLLTSTGSVSLRRSPLPVSMADPENASVSVRVGSDGLVRALALAYDARVGDDRATVRVEHRIVETGTASVSRPGWVPVSDSRDDPETAVDGAGTVLENPDRGSAARPRYVPLLSPQ